MSCTNRFITKTVGDGYRLATASDDHPPGVIVSSEKAYTSIIFRSHAHRYCAYCLSQFQETGKRCLGGCKYTHYCSRDCQRKDFGIHKHTCKKYHTIIGEAVRLYIGSGENQIETFPWEDFMLARKTYIIMCMDSDVSVKHNHSVHKVNIPEDIDILCQNESTEDGLSIDTSVAKIVAASFLLDRDGAVEFFEKLLNQFRFNNFGIQNSLQTVIAHGVFPVGAILNHSCNPNCILTYEGGEQVIRTIRNVKKGEELFHSYTDICQPTSIRRERLKITYGFLCKCDRCELIGKWKCIEEDLTKDEGYTDQDKEKVEDLLAKAQTISTEGSDDDIDSIRKEYEYLHNAIRIQEQKLGEYNLERYKTECLALSTSMLLGSDMTIAISHAQHLVRFLHRVCNQYHPLVLLQEMTLAELYFSQGNETKAMEMFELLVEKCKVSFGKNHRYVSHYQNLLAQFNGDSR